MMKKYKLAYVPSDGDPIIVGEVVITDKRFEELVLVPKEFWSGTMVWDPMSKEEKILSRHAGKYLLVKDDEAEG